MITLEELISLFGKPYNMKLGVDIDGIEIDSRRDVKNKLFFAIKGQKVDGHTFLEDVFSHGASGAFIEDERYLSVKDGINLFLVDSVVDALGKLARYYLDKVDKDMLKIAITGSAGKTTTRYLIAQALSHREKVYTPRKNLNTEIGVPLAIFGIPEDANILIFEFGADRPGDIAYLADMVRPEIGIITNIGPAHIEKFGSIEEVAHTKWALAERVMDEGLLLYNADDAILEKRAFTYNGRKLGFGRSPDAFTRLIDYEKRTDGEDIRVSVGGKIYSYRLHLFGMANIYNILALVSLLWYLYEGNIDFLEEIIPKLKPPEGRLVFKELSNKNIIIIDDTYNSNPLSLENSLEVLSRFNERRKIAILGDMLELGRVSRIYHREIGRKIAIKGWADMILAYGKDMAFLVDGASDFGLRDVHFFEDRDGLLKFLIEHIKPNDVCLFKASRGMMFEDILSKVMEFLDGK